MSCGIHPQWVHDAADCPVCLSTRSNPPVPSPTDQRIAERYFDACHIESQLDEALMRAFGAAVVLESSTLAGTPYLETDAETWPCGHMVYDDYDASFELWSIRDNDWVPTVEQLNAALDLGFARCWLVYKDGTERYCTGDRIGEKKPSTADRSSESKYLRSKVLQHLEQVTKARESIKALSAKWRDIASRPARPTGFLICADELDAALASTVMLPPHVRSCSKCRIENGCWVPCKKHQPHLVGDEQVSASSEGTERQP